MNQNDQLYLMELQTQCNFALRAQDKAYFSLLEDRPDITETWYNIQMFLVSIANVSKMLKSNVENDSISYKKHHGRIVSEYDLPKNYFTKEKKMRNSFEHYDENLVNWLETPSQLRALNNVGPIDAFISGAKFNYLKHFDPTTDTLHFDDLTINLKEAQKQLNLLNDRLEEILSSN